MTDAPERIWMDPDIRFPECEKQYGCGVEYIRADLVADVVAELCRDELIELICKAIGGGEKVGMVDFHVAEAIANALLARPSPDAIISAAQAVIDRWDSPDWKDEKHTADYINVLRRALNTPETRAEILADAMKGQTDD